VDSTVPGNPSRNALQGDALLRREDYAGAEAAFREAVRLEPDRANYHAGLGQALLGQKRYEAAARAFDEAVELRPDNAEYLAGLGEARLGHQDYDKAETAYRSAINLEARQPDYHAGLGQARLGQERYRSAEDAFRQAVELQPENADYRNCLGRAQLARERYEALARTTISDRAKTEPDMVSVDDHDRELLGWSRYLDPNPPAQGASHAIDAEALASEFADRTDPVSESAESHASAGRALLQQRRYDAAESEYRQAIELGPSRADYQAGLGYALLEQERYREAGKHFRVATSLAPDRADYLAALGQARLGQRHHSEAGAAFSEALHIAPDNSDYLSGLGHARLGENRYEEAETAFRQVLETNPDNADSLRDLGDALLGQKRYRDAQAIFTNLAKLRPDSADYLGSLGQALLGLNNFREAETIFRKATALGPSHVENWAGLGESLLGQGQYPEAETAFSEAVNLQPSNAYYHAGLGHAQAGRGDYASAEVAFSSAVTLDPSDLRYRTSLGKALLRQGDIERAQFVLDEAVAIDPGSKETTDLRQAISETYDEEIISHILQRAADALGAMTPELSTIQPDRYMDHVRDVASLNVASMREPFREWRKAGREARPRRRSFVWRILARRHSWLILTIAGILILPGLAVAANSVARSVTGTYIFPTLKSYAAPLALLSSLSALALLAILAAPVTRSLRKQSLPSSSALLLDRLNTLISNIVLEPAITASLGVIWRDPADDTVAVEDGSELSTKAEPDNIIPTEAFKRLAISLTRAHGAAVGVAGPRGSGKTELARAFTELGLHRSPTRTIPLMLWAPVEYNAQTFLLRLLKELCVKIISVGYSVSGGSDPVFAVHRRLRASIVILSAVGLIAVGALLIVTKFLNLDLRALSLILAGAALVIVGVSALFLELSSRIRPPSFAKRADLISARTVGLAAELRSRVEFTETYTKGSAIGMSGTKVSASLTTGTQLARIPLNEIDVVRELRNIVDTLAVDGWQVIVAIDELDKIADVDEALKFLNHVKVLFPIHECSFIVSVSQDAWSLFECRGLPLRDAFDSSFDEILLVDMLRPEESRDLLKRRCRDITDAQALLCHCLSGGLPRDLLRSVRFLARMASSLKESGRSSSPSLSDVLEQLFNEDLMAKVAAIRQGARNRPENLGAMNCEQLLLWIDAQFAGIASGIQPEPKIVKAYVNFLHTVREAFTTGGPVSRLDDRDGFRQPLITEGFDLIAQARRSLADDVSYAYSLLECARRTLGIGDIDLS
jgi:tetratricopeptide (TPR) repeat protein/energy-coupling factor transporter ATP-binding protein EcfA2